MILQLLKYKRCEIVFFCTFLEKLFFIVPTLLRSIAAKVSLDRADGSAVILREIPVSGVFSHYWSCDQTFDDSHLPCYPSIMHTQSIELLRNKIKMFRKALQIKRTSTAGELFA